MSGNTAPSPGSVIRYAYLWADESASGREEGRKDRPALVLTPAVRSDEDETELLVVAVTLTAPRAAEDGIELPAAEKRQLGLDDLQSSIVTTEANAFNWHGPDIRPIPDAPAGQMIYGRISAKLLTRVARSYLTNRRRGIGRLVERTN